jgi:hypothetical protein
MKYGIKHDNGKIIAITRFADDVVLAGFTEITKTKYDEFVGVLNDNPFSTYDTGANKVQGDSSKLSNAVSQQNKNKVRRELLLLSNELDLQTRMGEDTTDTQSEFDAKKLIYEGL